MKQQKIWGLACLFSLVLFFTVSFAPNIFAQTKAADQNSLRAMEKLQLLYQFLQEVYVDPVDTDALYQGAVEGMLNSLKDPYTMYIDNSSLAGVNLHDTTTGFFGGIGVSFIKPLASTPERPAYVEVSTAIEDTPSWKAGIQTGDLITAINGETTVDMTHSDVVAKLRGKIGSDVTVTIRRGKTMEFPVKLVRARIEVPTIKYTQLEDGIGYIRLIEFNPNSSRRIKEAALNLKQKGVNKLILDLRNNPGGLITAAVDTASLFLKEGEVLSSRSRIEQYNVTYTVNPSIPAVLADIPLVVLVNKGSASASEILAGMLKDYKRAYLVGETTYGKGSVQQLFDLSPKSSFKVTIARYYVPSGANIDKTGIKPDEHIPMYPPLNFEDERNLEKLIRDEKIPGLVKNRPALTDADITEEARRLAKEYKIPEELMRLLIRQEYNRTHVMPVADVLYDPPLQKAVEILTQNRLTELLKNTSTVLEDQQAAAADTQKQAS